MLLTAVALVSRPPVGAYTQEVPPRAPLSHGTAPTLSFRHFGVDEGLSSWRANAIVQDRAGYMWIGTPNGLDRFDGYEVKTYRNDPADPYSLSGSYVSALYEDRGGRLWVGTQAGLDIYDSRTERFDRKIGSDVIASANALFEDRAGVFWIGTFGNGLYSFDPGTAALTPYRHDPGNASSLSSDNVNEIFEDRTDTLWIATLDGLNRLDRATGGFTAYRHDPLDPHSLSDDAVWAVFQDRSGTLWVGTDGGGLNRFDPASGRFAAYRHDPDDPNTLSDDRLSRMFEDENGALWVGTFSGGVSVLDPARERFTTARHDTTEPSSLSNNSVTDITADRSGLIWVGTAGGVDVYDPQRQAYLLYQQGLAGTTGLASNNVTAVHQDAAGRLWVGTRDSGVDVVDRLTGEVRHVTGGNDGQRLSNPFIWDITSDRSGKVWISTYGGGLYRLDPESGSLSAFRSNPTNARGLSDDVVGDLLADRTGGLWIGTRSGGLNHLDPGSSAFTVYRHDQADPGSLSHDTVRGLVEDLNGYIWVGTADGGLNRLDPATGGITHFRHNPSDASSLADDSVYALHVDRRGGLWVGLQGAGVDRFEPEPDTAGGAPRGTFTHFRERDGLASDEVLAILEDGPNTDSSAGNIWVVTGRGLSRIDAQSRTIRSYRSSEGLPSAPFTRGHDTTPDGRLLLGSVNGLIDFDPRAARDDAYVPPIVFSAFLIANKPVVPGDSGPLARPIDMTDTVQVGWDARVISIESAALSFRAPEFNRYRYMLDGFDTQWSEVDSTRRLVTYTNLDPGSYVFRVTGSNGSGVWNPTGRAMTLIISPPWWGTLWFRLLGTAIIAGGLLVAYLWRVRHLKAQHRLLETVVAQRTQALEEALGTQQAALETRDEFLRALAHDLKAPLSNLAWHVQLLNRRARDGRLEPDALDTGLQAISIDCAEAVAAIDELHDLTRLAAGSPLPLQLEPVDLVALARQLVAARQETSRHDLELVSDYETLTGRVDRARLARMLDNLLDNATKYSPAGG